MNYRALPLILGCQDDDANDDDIKLSRSSKDVEINLKGFDYKILQLLQILNTKERDTLIDMLINWFDILSSLEYWQLGIQHIFSTFFCIKDRSHIILLYQ